MKKLILTTFAVFAGGLTVAGAQEWDSTATETVAPGVVHRRLVINRGPWRMHLLEVDLTTPGLSLRGVRSNDMFRGREPVTSMVHRYKGPGKAVAGVNGDFFNVRIRTGESENNVLIEGALWKGVRMTDSPYDTYDNLHSQFGVDWRNRPFIDRFGLDATIIERGRRAVRLDGINFRQDSNAIVLYTPAIGDSTPVDSATTSMLSVQMKLLEKRGDTMVLRVAGGAHEARTVRLDGGYAIAASGSGRAFVRGLSKRSRTIRIVARIVPDRGKLRTMVGGWPRLIRNGKSVAEYADILEGTFPRFSAGKHPRTAIGFSKDSTKLLLFTVDGRRESDAGMTLVEAAAMMLALGAHDAMAFDGGGSTTMVINGKVVNRPSDETGERAVGAGLIVVLDPLPAR
ncbi:MAG: phosphodiester glycosidase family protein [Gemmatimonadaceae bacterium]